MTVKETFKVMFFLSCVVTTFLLLFIGLQGVVFSQEISFDGWDLLKLISIAFASALPTLIFVGQEDASRLKTIVISSLHFVLTAGAVFGLQALYGYLDATNAFSIAVVFLVIYATAYTAIEIRAKKLADRLNERINAFHGAQNETHKD